MESVTVTTPGNGTRRNGTNGTGAHGNGSSDANGDGAGMDDAVELQDLWRVWVTPSDRKRCTYVTRDEQPLAAANSANR